MKVLDVKTFMHLEAPIITHNIALASGINVGSEFVNEVLTGWNNGESFEHSYVRSMYIMVNYAVEHMGWHYTLQHILEMSSLVHKPFNSVQGSVSALEWREIETQLERLHEIKDYRIQAVIAFCYVAQLEVLRPCAVEVGLLLANEILLGAMVGYLEIPISMMEEFRRELKVYLTEGESGRLQSILREHCIVPIGDI